MDNNSYKSYFNLFGNTKVKYFGVKENTSFIGKNQNNEIVKFGILDPDTTLDYRQDKGDKSKFFQKNLKFLDVCETTIFKPIYYNVVYKLICDNDLIRKSPAFKVNTGRCFIEIEIFSKEACNYEKLSYDSYFVKYKFFICLYYILFIIMLVNKEKLLTYAAANIYSMILICYIFLFYFSLCEKIIIIPLIVSILIGIYSVSYFKEEIPVLNNILLHSTSGFIVGELIIEIIFIYFKILSNIEFVVIIIIFIFAFNLTLFLFQNKSYIICSSILFAYFLTNLFKIAQEDKIPFITIANSLLEEGFEISMMKDFIPKKYFIYYLIFIGALILILLLKILVYKEKLNEKENLNRNINRERERNFIFTPSTIYTSKPFKTTIHNATEMSGH